MPQNLLIIGATGVIGKPITKEIIKAKSSFGHIAVLTSENTIQNKPAEINALRDSGVEILTGDITKEEDIKNAYQSIPVLSNTLPIWQLIFFPQISTPSYPASAGTSSPNRSP
jgi:short-subunit dehydrogenase